MRITLKLLYECSREETKIGMFKNYAEIIVISNYHTPCL